MPHVNTPTCMQNMHLFTIQVLYACTILSIIQVLKKPSFSYTTVIIPKPFYLLLLSIYLPYYYLHVLSTVVSPTAGMEKSPTPPLLIPVTAMV